MMSVGIDCRFASSTGGLGTYTRKMVSALCKLHKSWQPVLFVSSIHEEWLSELPSGVRIVPVPFAHYSLAEQCYFPGVIKRSGVQLFHSLYFAAPLRCSVPYMVTVHDLILHKYANQAGVIRRLAYQFLFSRSVRRAEHIVCVSESTKRYLLAAEPGIDTGSVSVIYPGVSPLFTARSLDEQRSIRTRYGLPERFLLYVGNSKQHKNVQMLIDAFVSADHGDVQLILVTGGKEAAKLHISRGVRVVQFIEQADLPALFSAAAGFATATLYEGFGLPVVEALCCGCPVLATNTTSIPEIAGGLVTLVEPTFPSLVAGLGRLLATTERPAVSDVFRQRFDWRQSAEKLNAIFARHPV